jgi:hypothetical protein
MFGKIPKEHEYDFILIDQKQNESDGVCSKGYLVRGEKKLNKLLQQIDEYKANGQWICYRNLLRYATGVLHAIKIRLLMLIRNMAEAVTITVYGSRIIKYSV